MRTAVLAGIAVGTLGVVGVAVAATSSTPAPTNQTSVGHGINEAGMTTALYNGKFLPFTYSHGFYCDTSVTSHASTGCEAGANYKRPPRGDFDPLYITVPLGFQLSRYMIDCPATLVCVDHPGTIDLSRLEPALKPLYPKLTAAQLTAVLRNAPTPEHDHFVTTDNNSAAEWWDVKIIGVTSPKTYSNIKSHRSYSYIQSLLKAHDKTVVGPINTNLFLYFSVAP